MRETRRIAGLAVLAMALAGCGILGGSKPLDTYELTAPAPDGRHGRSRSQILIAEPSALKALDGQNIVIKPSPGVIQFLKGAQWSDRLPKIVQAKLAEAFQSTHAFAGVGKPGEGLAIDYQVVAEIRAFEVRVNGGTTADIDIFIRILNDRNGVVRAAQDFAASSQVSGSGNDAFIRALDAAFGDVVSQIVDWTDRRI